MTQNEAAQMRSDRIFTKTGTSKLYTILLGATVIAASGFVSAAAQDNRAPIRYATAQTNHTSQTSQLPRVPVTSSRTVQSQAQYVGGKPFDPRAAAAKLAAKPVSEPHRVPPKNISYPQSKSDPAQVQAKFETKETRLAGTGFAPVSSTSYDASGGASVYSSDFFGEPTASGEILDPKALTAAHPSLPLPSLVQVINSDTGREIVVRVNDRGPFEGNGLIELTPRAAQLLGVSAANRSTVRVRYLGPAETKQRPSSLKSDGPQPSVTSKIVEVGMAPLPGRSTSTSKPQFQEPSLPVDEPVGEIKQELTQDMAPKGEANFYVQAGSFGQFDNAVAFREKLMVKHNVGILKVNVRGRDFFRVVVGPFDFKETALKTRAELKRAGVDSIVIPAKQ